VSRHVKVFPDWYAEVVHSHSGTLKHTCIRTLYVLECTYRMQSGSIVVTPYVTDYPALDVPTLQSSILKPSWGNPSVPMHVPVHVPSCRHTYMYMYIYICRCVKGVTTCTRKILKLCMGSLNCVLLLKLNLVMLIHVHVHVGTKNQLILHFPIQRDVLVLRSHPPDDSHPPI
jgi:hypothetical protein